MEKSVVENCMDEILIDIGTLSNRLNYLLEHKEYELMIETAIKLGMKCSDYTAFKAVLQNYK